MSIDRFTQNDTIKAILKEVEVLKASGKQFSDIIDKDGYQYVDLVQEGGGVLGVALVGYTFVLENAGIRFFSLAGTSAGAINTMMMAGLGTIDKPQSEKILKILISRSLFTLVDGDKSVKKLIDKVLKKESLLWLLAWRGLRIFNILKRKLGLNPGDVFQDWISTELTKAGVSNLRELRELRSKLPDHLHTRDGEPLADKEADLAVIASDITTSTKAQFPKMAELYWKEPDQVHPADFVRASMSIPAFFSPFKVQNLPNAGREKDPLWDDYARYYGPVPDTVMFVDGGLLSNFPINVFHQGKGVPRKPTFGVRLSAYREMFNDANDLAGVTGAVINTMRQIHDYDFLLRNPDFRELICRIDADQKFNWLDFKMSNEDQVKLFNLGATKARAFLKDFDWDKYKALRAKEV